MSADAPDDALPVDLHQSFRDAERDRDAAVRVGDLVTVREKIETMNRLARRIGETA